MPWKVVSIVWPRLVAALLPLELSDVISRLPRIIERLAALDTPRKSHPDRDRSRPRQVDDFRSRFVLPEKQAA
jgi:hypothetical protein